MTFENKYKIIKKLAKDELNFIENYMVQCINTREPLSSHIINFLKAPSKRIRPVISILYYKSIFSDIKDNQLKALAAIELIHSASLIHDDIIDQSNLRRGMKTISNEFGNKLGVISGDYLLSIAMNILAELNSIELVKNVSNTLNKMCIGEINQNYDRFKIGNIENYIEKSKDKTAYLFQTAMGIPFYIGEYSKYLENALNFGLNLGIAFQIRDDLLNLISDDLSKPTQNDISEGIYTAPVIYGGSVDKYLDGVEKTRVLLNNYIKNTSVNIKGLPDNIYKKGLEQFLELLGND